MPLVKTIQDFLGISAPHIENPVEEITSEFDATKFNVPIQQFEWHEFFEPDLFRTWNEELKNSLTRFVIYY